MSFNDIALKLETNSKTVKTQMRRIRLKLKKNPTFLFTSEHIYNRGGREKQSFSQGGEYYDAKSIGEIKEIIEEQTKYPNTTQSTKRLNMRII